MAIDTKPAMLPPSTVSSPPPIEVDVAPEEVGASEANRARGMRREVRRQLGGARLGDLFALVGAVTASLSTTWAVTTQIMPVTGSLGPFLIAFALFVAFYTLLLSFTEPTPIVRDRVASVVVHSLAIIVVLTLIFVVAFTIFRGLEALRFPNFFVQDMSLAGPLDPLSAGGIVHAIVGSLIQITIALVITIPLGILTALYLNEMPGRFASFVRTVVEAMSALPSIVAGLFIYATAILILGLEKSGFAAALAISVMMLPIMIRASDVVIRMVPSTLKEGAIGLGAGQWRTVWHVVLPTSRSGLATAIILATARGIGETSPVLLTSGFTAAMNLDPLRGPMVSLPLAVFQFVKSPEPTMIARGFGAAAVLMLLVLLLFAGARWLGGRTIEKQDRARHRRERALASVVAAIASIGRAVRHIGRRAVPVLRAAHVAGARVARAINGLWVVLSQRVRQALGYRSPEMPPTESIDPSTSLSLAAGEQT